MRNLREVDENNQPGRTAVLPWVERAASEYLLRGPAAIGFSEFTPDEQLAVLRMVIELVVSRSRTRRRPCTRRRTAA